MMMARGIKSRLIAHDLLIGYVIIYDMSDIRYLAHMFLTIVFKFDNTINFLHFKFF